MKVTSDVIVDLWPLYEAGEASADTRALVESFLEGDPEFARKIREGEEATTRMLTAVPVLPPPDAERAALARTKLLLRLRFHFLAAACALSLLAVVLRQYRAFSATVAVLAAATWVGLVIVTRGRRLATAAVAPSAPPFDRWRLACASVSATAGLFALLVRTFREYSVPLAIVGGLAWAGLEIVARWRRKPRG